MTAYTDLIKQGYEDRIHSLRVYLSKRCVKMGMSVMPHDVVDVMNKADRNGQFKHLLFNGFVNPYGKYLLLIDVYDGLGFEMPEEQRELNIDNLQTYF